MTPHALRSGTVGSMAPARGTLTRSLIIRVVLIISVLTVLVASVSTLVARGTLMNQLDTRLAGVANRQELATDNPGEDLPGGVDLPGQPIGTVVVEVEGNVALHGYLGDEGIKPLPGAEDVARLARLPMDGQASNIDLAELGPYRVYAVHQNGHKVVVGLPLARTSAAITSMVAILALVSLLAVVLGGGTVYLLVVRHLRPLSELAETATRVSATPLAHGRVDLPRAEVPPEGRAVEVANVARTFNEMLEHLEAALQAREQSETRMRRFVADVSHELRNPLAAMRGYAELARRDVDTLPGPTAWALTQMDLKSERISALVQDLLLLARLDNAPQETGTEQVDLSELVVTALMDAQVASTDHMWALELPPEPVLTRGDRHQLQQVVANLLANAALHTPSGTTVTASLVTSPTDAPGDPEVALEVHDDGPGIPAAILGSVFDRFVRGDASRSHQEETSGRISTGLGLSIVAAVVGAHGGTATVDSYCPRDAVTRGDSPAPGTPRGWTRFTVRLPRLVEEEAADTQPEQQLLAPPPAPPRSAAPTSPALPRSGAPASPAPPRSGAPANPAPVPRVATTPRHATTAPREPDSRPDDYRPSADRPHGYRSNGNRPNGYRPNGYRSDEHRVGDHRPAARSAGYRPADQRPALPAPRSAAGNAAPHADGSGLPESQATPLRVPAGLR